MKIVNILVTDNQSGIFSKMIGHLEDRVIFDPTEDYFEFDFESSIGEQYRIQPIFFSGQEEYTSAYDAIFRRSSGFILGVSTGNAKQMDFVTKQLQSIANVFDGKKKPPVYVLYTGKFKEMDDLWFKFPFMKAFRSIQFENRGSFALVMGDFCQESVAVK
jgi:hypothetical protein